MARRAHGRLREPRAAEGRRPQGRRPPGLVGEDGHADDGALAVRARAPRTAISVKPHASPVLHAIEYLLGWLDGSYLTHAARLRRAAGVPVAARRIRCRSTTRPARSASAPPRRCSARSPTATSTTTASSADRRPLHLAARRRRARRGQHLGGDRRARSRAGSANVLWIVDLNRQSLDRVDPGHPREPSSSGASHERLGRDRAEVRPPAAGGVAPSRAASCCAARIDDDAERAVPVALRRERGADRPRRARAAARRAATACGSSALLEPLPRRRGAARCATSAATTSATCSRRCARRATTDRPTVIFAYTIKGYGLQIAGPAAEPLGAADRRADRRAARASSGSTRERRVGPLRAGLARGGALLDAAAERARASAARRPPSGSAIAGAR